MQSADYVPGVSGWKMEKGLFELNGGPFGPVRMGDLSAPEPSVTDEQLAAICLTKEDLAEPFVVLDGVTFINQALIADGAISNRIIVEVSARASSDAACESREQELKDALAGFTSSKSFLVDLHPFAVKMTKGSGGRYVCAGAGVGVLGEQKPASADEILQLLASSVSESKLGVELQSRVDAIESVRDVIRQELKPGGLLHRR